MLLCIPEATTASTELFCLGLITFKNDLCLYIGIVLACRTQLGGWVKLTLLISFH